MPTAVAITFRMMCIIVAVIVVIMIVAVIVAVIRVVVTIAIVRTFPVTPIIVAIFVLVALKAVSPNTAGDLNGTGAVVTSLFVKHLHKGEVCEIARRC